ncbi:MAG: hypothetical protein Q4F41_01275 [Eubacteriales bacterium]|nr:hypothetical protein [Eubacteriales bacterium]
MNSEKRYLRLSFPVIFACVFAVVFLLGQLLAEQRKEREDVLLTAELPNGEITNELLSQFQAFPGFQQCWAVLTGNVSIRIAQYQASATLCGVDLDSYPLTIVESAGAKAFGSKPLLIVGESFWSSLTDEYGNAITSRQIQVLTQELDTLEAELELDGAVYAAEFLGVAEEDGIYIDVSQLKPLLEAGGGTGAVSRVCLKIKGVKNAERARESLEKAGFACA